MCNDDIKKRHVDLNNDVNIPVKDARTYAAFCLDCNKVTEQKQYSKRGGGGYLICIECQEKEIL